MTMLLLFLLLAMARPARATQLFGSGASGGSGGITPPAGDIGGTISAPTVIAIHRTVKLIVHSQSPYSLAAGDSYLDCNAASGNVTLNLPAASGSGRVLTFKDTGASGTCTVTPNGSDTIDGASNLVVSTQYQPVNLVDAASGKWDVSSLNVAAGTGISASTANGLTTVTVNIAGGTCTNQYVTALSATGTLTCSTDTLASAAHANQGTTTTVLHGNAAGNPSWSAVNLATDVTGTMPVANGGTGFSSSWPVSQFYVGGCSSPNAWTITANDIGGFTFVVPVPVTFSNLAANINAADSSHNADYGIYTLSGTLVADVGAQEFGSTQAVDHAVITNASCTGSGTPSACCTGSGTGTCPTTPLTIQPGVYIFAAAGATGTTLKFNDCVANGYLNYWGGSASLGTSSNGILPASVTSPSKSVTNQIPVMGLD